MTTQRTRICATVTAATTAELRSRRDRIDDADLVELRLDTVSDPDVAGALQGRCRPAVITCRPKWEGGAFAGSEDERRRLLGEALDAGAEYVDVEWRAGFNALVARDPGRIVLSVHDFDGVPVDLIERSHAMRGTGAGIVKVAVTATRLADCVRLLDLSRTFERTRSVLIGMGEPGLSTRVLAARLGSAWTYAGALSEVGQLTTAALIHGYHFKTLSESTSLYGVVGSPVAHSLSPAMHNAVIRAAGRDAVYLPLAAADVEDFVTFARAFDVRGASVTIPFKVAMFSHVLDVDDLTRRVGALNTLRMNGVWSGTNTDVDGFLAPLRARGVPLTGTRASVLGAGGAARAVALALTDAGASVRVHARDMTKARHVAEAASAAIGPWPPEPRSWDLLVNATPIGMTPNIDVSPVPHDSLTGTLVYDLVYNPPVTALLRDADRAGCTTIGGLEMLVAQAEAQVRFWTGSLPEAGVMRAAAAERLAGGVA